MTSLRILPKAAEELREASRYYESVQSGLGAALTGEVRRTFRRIKEYPRAARIERNEIRVLSVARFPYRIYYRARDAEILIVAIGHRRRRPGYWRDRTAT